MGLREVWRYVDERLVVHRLEGEAYVEVEDSAVLPELDRDELLRFARRPDTHEALKAYRAALKA